MHYTKPALSFEQQAQRLLDRGMLGADKNALVAHLSMVNYYRLSAYWYPYKQIDPNTGGERFKPGTTFNYIRNVCAHHGRLWNRELAIRPIIPYKKHHPEFYIPQSMDNRRVYAVLALLRYLLRFIDPQNDWQNRLEMLLQTYSDISIYTMGFPTDWKNCPIWK
jgi:abortive infection bacteriophage resistance protein